MGTNWIRPVWGHTFSNKSCSGSLKLLKPKLFGIFKMMYPSSSSKTETLKQSLSRSDPLETLNLISVHTKILHLSV